MKKASAGFTLIELVIVIVILGILAATALPRFLDVSDSAHAAAFKSGESALRSGIQLARAKALLDSELPAAGGAVTLEGTDEVVVRENRWPEGNDNARCGNILQVLVEGGEGFEAKGATNGCTFEYKAKQHWVITYNHETGRVTSSTTDPDA